MNTNKIAPAIGMPCTISIGSDRYAARVVGVTPSARIVTVQRHCTCCQDFSHGWNPMRFVLQPSGRYTYRKSYKLALGIAEEHMDPSF